MKKYVLILALVVVLALAGTALAQAVTADNPSGWNFGQMLPFMQQMHPDLNTDQLREMYEDCHGTGGARPSKGWNMMMGS